MRGWLNALTDAAKAFAVVAIIITAVIAFPVFRSIQRDMDQVKSDNVIMNQVGYQLKLKTLEGNPRIYTSGDGEEFLFLIDGNGRVRKYVLQYTSGK